MVPTHYGRAGSHETLPLDRTDGMDGAEKLGGNASTATAKPYSGDLSLSSFNNTMEGNVQYDDQFETEIYQAMIHIYIHFSYNYNST